MKLLHIVSDPLPKELAVDKRVASSFLKTLCEQRPDCSVTELNLYQDPPPYFDLNQYRYVWQRFTEPEYRPTQVEIDSADYLNRHIDLFNQSDIVVLTAPVWNYFVPAILKAWVDQVVCPEHSFRFGSTGPEPLHKVKSVVFILSAGGFMSKNNTHAALFNLLQAPFEFIGISDFYDVFAEGQEASLYPDHQQRKEKAIEDCKNSVSRLVANFSKQQ